MFWWQKQSGARKLLLLISVLSLTAGLSGGQKAAIGGVFIFLITLLLAFLIPNHSLNAKDKEWVSVISPHLYGKEKLQRLSLAVVAIIISLFVLFMLFRALVVENYMDALLFTVIFLATISSFIYLFPNLYNEIFVRSKIIPLQKKITTQKLCEELSKVNTPFGKPLMGRVEWIKEPVAVYRIVDFNWIVYFYVHDNEVRIHSHILFSDELDREQAYWVYLFTQQLCDLICFYINTKELPDQHETLRIFNLLRM